MSKLLHQEFYPKTRSAWRRWLTKNHSTRSGVWLVYFKKDSGKSTITYNDAVEEALCFGWIDSTKYKRDDQSSRQLFAPRKTKSTWSSLNKLRIKKLIKHELMTAFGMLKITEAKKNGSWNLLNDVEKMIIPPDLKKAFLRNKKAWSNFQNFAPSARKGILWWIKSAKREETRQERISKTVTMAAKNLKAN